MNFNEMNLDSRLLRAIEELGFESPSPIQEQAIPYALTGNDLVGQAQTGTGKTAAFGLPALQQIDPESRSVQALILCPTRELAIQVSDEIRKLAKYMHGIRTLAVYGGQDINRQIKAMKGGVSIIIGTPGRIMDHMRRKTIRFNDLKIAILDEADEMLNMGFRDDIETILKETPSERQTLLFSATMPKPIMELAKTYQKDAKIIKVVKKELTVQNITQKYYRIRPQDRVAALCRLLDVEQPKRCVVFCNTKRGVDDLVKELNERDYAAEPLHGDLKQMQRDRVMNGFRTGKTSILVATDVAARGIDVDDVEAVFNFELPQDEEYYVHRIGRTGRAGKEGKAFSFVNHRDFYRLKSIERYCRCQIKPGAMPTARDVKRMRFKKVFDEAKELLDTTSVESYVERLKQRLEEENIEPIYIAAALIRKELGEDRIDNFKVEEPYKTKSFGRSKRDQKPFSQKQESHGRSKKDSRSFGSSKFSKNRKNNRNRHKEG